MNLFSVGVDNSDNEHEIRQHIFKWILVLAQWDLQ